MSKKKSVDKVKYVTYKFVHRRGKNRVLVSDLLLFVKTSLDEVMGRGYGVVETPTVESFVTYRSSEIDEVLTIHAVYVGKKKAREQSVSTFNVFI